MQVEQRRKWSRSLWPVQTSLKHFIAVSEVLDGLEGQSVAARGVIVHIRTPALRDWNHVRSRPIVGPGDRGLSSLSHALQSPRNSDSTPAKEIAMTVDVEAGAQRLS